MSSTRIPPDPSDVRATCKHSRARRRHSSVTLRDTPRPSLVRYPTNVMGGGPLSDRSSITSRFKLKPLCRLFHRISSVDQRASARKSTALRRPRSSIPVSNILTLTSSDRLVQQSNGVITREVEATHRLRRRSIVTCDDCIAIKADEVFGLWIHRRSALLSSPVDVSDSPPRTSTRMIRMIRSVVLTSLPGPSWLL